MIDEKIIPLGVTFKHPRGEEKMLSLVPRGSGCLEHAYVIDPEASEVTCSICKKSFSPMAVLVDLARKESRWMQNGKAYREDMKRLSARERTKCEHCQKITRISRN